MGTKQLDTVTITIVGKRQCGKSILAKYIQDMLLAAGCHVKCVDGHLASRQHEIRRNGLPKPDSNARVLIHVVDDQELERL